VDRFGPAPGSPNPSARAIQTGRTWVARNLTEEDYRRFTVNDEHFQLTMKLRYLSAISVPLLGRDRVLGSMSLILTDRSNRQYTDEDVALAEDLARRVGTLLDNVRLFQAQEQVVRTLQQGLLPPELPSIPGVEVAAA